MKNFILPGFYEKFNINSQLINLIENCPEIFHENIKISAIYGNMGFNVWEGGRVYLSYNRAYKEDMERIRDFYHEKNIPIRLTFTNPIVNKEHLNDSYCNLITSIFETGENEILVNSKILEEYLRIKYPNYKFCSSTTKCITNKEELKNEINSYFQICLDYNLNSNYNLLNDFSVEEKNRIELLCNAICPPGCPNRKKHYLLNGNFMISGGQSYGINCLIDKNILHPELLNSKNNISPEKIEEWYLLNNFHNFKLEGRTLSDITLIGIYAYYLVKKEYQMDFYTKFIL